MLFDSFEAYDVQETRRVSREEGAKAKLIELICKKIQKHCQVEEIAEALEENTQNIQRIYNVAVKYAPDYDVEKILEELKLQKEN